MIGAVLELACLFPCLFPALLVQLKFTGEKNRVRLTGGTRTPSSHAQRACWRLAPPLGQRFSKHG